MPSEEELFYVIDMSELEINMLSLHDSPELQAKLEVQQLSEDVATLKKGFKELWLPFRNTSLP